MITFNEILIGFITHKTEREKRRKKERRIDYKDRTTHTGHCKLSIKYEDTDPSAYPAPIKVEFRCQIKKDESESANTLAKPKREREKEREREREREREEVDSRINPDWPRVPQIRSSQGWPLSLIALQMTGPGLPKRTWTCAEVPRRERKRERGGVSRETRGEREREGGGLPCTCECELWKLAIFSPTLCKKARLFALSLLRLTALTKVTVSSRSKMLLSDQSTTCVKCSQRRKKVSELHGSVGYEERGRGGGGWKEEGM